MEVINIKKHQLSQLTYFETFSPKFLKKETFTFTYVLFYSCCTNLFQCYLPQTALFFTE